MLTRHTARVDIRYSAEVRGCDEYFADPLNCAIELIPAGITFPSCKDRGGPSATRHHTCQILVPAEWRWFDRHAPLPEYSAKDLRHGARHAPPHVPRSSQKEYDALKKRWADRLVALLLRYFPAIDKDEHIAFVDVSTPMTIERCVRQLVVAINKTCCCLDSTSPVLYAFAVHEIWCRQLSAQWKRWSYWT